MAIYYDQENKTFTLSTKNTSYQMKVDTYGVLIHTYYGEKIGQEDMSYLVDLRDSGFSGNIYEAGNKRDYSLDTLPQEYSSSGVGDYRITSVSVRNRTVRMQWIFGMYLMRSRPESTPSRGFPPSTERRRTRTL